MRRLVWFVSSFLVSSFASAQDTQVGLEQALALARSHRASVAAAQQRVISAQASRRALGAFPATRLFLGYTTPVEVGGSDDDFVISQPLDLFGRRGAARAIGDASIQRAESELKVALAEVQFAVMEEYSEAAAAKALADSARQNKEIAQQLNDAIKVLVEEGRLPGVQLTRVGIELERARLAEGQRRAEYEASLERLSAVLNVPRAQLDVAGFAPVALPALDDAALLAQRPDLQVLAADVRSAEAEVRTARLGNHPELELQARRSPWQDRDARFGARIQLSFTISDYGRTRSETSAAQSRVVAAQKVLADARRIAESDLKSSRIELEAAQAQITRYEAIVQSARLLVERSRVGYNERAVTLVELLEGTRALREVEEDYVGARRRLASAQARYLRAGGVLIEVPK